MRKRLSLAAVLAILALGVPLLAALPADASSIENRDATVHSVDINRASKNNARPTSSPLLSYRGGAISQGGKVFVVYWGSQWGTAGSDGANVTLSNDTAGVAPYQQRYLKGLGGDTWSGSTTQYCQGVATGTTKCGTSGQHVGASTFGDVLVDNGAAAPSQPTQSQLAAEAVKAANHFATNGGFDQATDQIVVDTFSHNNASGFGTQYCAWHSSTTYGSGRLAYTNMPYLPDAGASCGANYVPGASAGEGPLEGVSIVGGHEFAETITDMFPNGGWLDSQGGENGDKCAWKKPGTAGGSALVTLTDGKAYAMQSLWSNSFGTGGGCVISYTSTGQSDGLTVKPV